MKVDGRNVPSLKRRTGHCFVPSVLDAHRPSAYVLSPCLSFNFGQERNDSSPGGPRSPDPGRGGRNPEPFDRKEAGGDWSQGPEQPAPRHTPISTLERMDATAGAL